jgi:hypothetical protein
MTSKFLTANSNSSLVNGTIPIKGLTLSATNLEPSKALKTNSLGELESENLLISDVDDLQNQLQTKENLNFINQATQPSLPPLQQTKVYTKTDGLYLLDSNGTETQIGSGQLSISTAPPLVTDSLLSVDATDGTSIKQTPVLIDILGNISNAGLYNSINLFDVDAATNQNTNDIVTINNDIQTIQTEQITQNNRLTLAEDKITNIEAEQNIQNTRLTTTEDKTTANENEITLLQGRATTIEAEQITQNNRLTTTEDKTTANTNDIANLQTATANVVSNVGLSTDNAIAKFDLTTGKLIQDSGVIIDDLNNVALNGQAITINSDNAISSYSLNVNDGVDALVLQRDANTLPLIALNGATGDLQLGGSLYAGAQPTGSFLSIGNGGAIGVGQPVNNTIDISVTNNAICRFNETSGKDIQNSGVILDDLNNISGVNDMTVNTLNYSTLNPSFVSQSQPDNATARFQQGVFPLPNTSLWSIDFNNNAPEELSIHEATIVANTPAWNTRYESINGYYTPLVNSGIRINNAGTYKILVIVNGDWDNNSRWELFLKIDGVQTDSFLRLDNLGGVCFEATLAHTTGSLSGNNLVEVFVRKLDVNQGRTFTLNSLTFCLKRLGDITSQDYRQTTTPANPAVGNQRVFFDIADGLMKSVDNAGTITIISPDPTLRADIDTNTGNISTNTSNISTNTTNIGTNTGNIALNTGNISTNTSDILNLQTATANVVSNVGLSTDNAIPKFDLTTGKLIQNTGVIIDDLNNITGAGTYNSINITQLDSDLTAAFGSVGQVGSINDNTARITAVENNKIDKASADIPSEYPNATHTFSNLIANSLFRLPTTTDYTTILNPTTGDMILDTTLAEVVVFTGGGGGTPVQAIDINPPFTTTDIAGDYQIAGWSSISGSGAPNYNYPARDLYDQKAISGGIGTLDRWISAPGTMQPSLAIAPATTTDQFTSSEGTFNGPWVKLFNNASLFAFDCIQVAHIYEDGKNRAASCSIYISNDDITYTRVMDNQTINFYSDTATAIVNGQYPNFPTGYPVPTSVSDTLINAVKLSRAYQLSGGAVAARYVVFQVNSAGTTDSLGYVGVNELYLTLQGAAPTASIVPAIVTPTFSDTTGDTVGSYTVTESSSFSTTYPGRDLFDKQPINTSGTSTFRWITAFGTMTPSQTIAPATTQDQFTSAEGTFNGPWVKLFNSAGLFAFDCIQVAHAWDNPINRAINFSIYVSDDDITYTRVMDNQSVNYFSDTDTPITNGQYPNFPTGYTFQTSPSDTLNSAVKLSHPYQLSGGAVAARYVVFQVNTAGQTNADGYVAVNEVFYTLQGAAPGVGGGGWKQLTSI